MAGDEEAKKEELVALINSRIEGLRPKLLDLTRRNTLLSTRFSEKSNSHVRVIDELPDILFQQLNEGRMELASLPPLEDDPKDEQNRSFQNRFTEARITDPEYKADLEAIDPDDPNEPQKIQDAERRLKDKVRAELGMPERQTKKNLSLAQHARNNNIRPGYDLPAVSETNDDGRHNDSKIQTMLTPELLERKMNAMISKCKGWVQETGLDVLRAAFGFLEWYDVQDSRPVLAPLVLLPIEIQKKKSSEGSRFSVEGLGDASEQNTVLAEKLRIDFGLELPKFSQGMSLENYFDEVGKLSPRGMKWRVRRQIAIGVFPSARMAMYHDLNTERFDFAEQPVINNLFGSNESSQNISRFGDDYNVDHPDVEVKVPLTVLDSDSSQFSAMVDVADGKNIAVEGPPGTGKSQTIVNTIATMLAQGKKILFVAEKTAALEVVRARLEACELGPFLLTLQAVRSSKEQVIKSIRERLDLRNEREPQNYETVLREFKRTRSKLQDYIACVASVFGETEMTVYDILGNSISSHGAFAKLSDVARRALIPSPNRITQRFIQEIAGVCGQLETAWQEAENQAKYWRCVRAVNLDPYSAEEILSAAEGVGKKFLKAAECRQGLREVGLSDNSESQYLQSLLTTLKMLPEEIGNIKLSLLRRLKTRKSIDDIRGYLFDLSQVKKQRAELEELFLDPLDTKLPEVLEKLGDLSNQYGLVELSSSDLGREIGLLKEQEKRIGAASVMGKELAQYLNGAEAIKLKYLLAACDLIQSFDRSLLALRNSEFEGEDFKSLLTKYKAEAIALKERRETLSQIFTLDSLPDISELEKQFQVLEKSGVFSWIMPKYHEARKFYKNLSQPGKWDGKSSRGKVRQLINWRKGKDSYEKDEIIKNALKTRFDGIETNFGIFEKIIAYYGSVDTALRGLADRRLRDYLYAVDTDSLLALPAIPEKHLLREFCDETVSGLMERTAELGEAIKYCEKFRTEFETLLRYFTSPETFKVNDLKEKRNLVLAFNLRRKKLTADEPIKALLGELFGRLDDFREGIAETLDVAEKLTSQKSDVFDHLVMIIENETVKKNIEIITQALQADEEALSALNHLAHLSECGSEDLYSGLSRQAFASLMQLAAQDKLGLLAHSTVAQYLKELEVMGFKEIIDELIVSGEGCHDLSEKIEAAIYQAQAREAFRLHGKTLAKNKGIELNKLRQQLAHLDKTIIELSRKRLRVGLLKNANPPRGNHTGRRSELTEKALLEHEITKTRGYVSVRDLTARAGKALLELKPCWMVSPLAVAQYIEKGKIKFDLVIIDEASQMTPEDAVGALARGGQAMIVGDTNQLPPSDFFRKHFEEEESDDVEILTEESILEMANAVFRPARRLRWHYRSRDARLIAFSNKYVYDNNLVIFPGAVDNNSQTGVAFEKVSGLYVSGTNPIEAKHMTDAAVKFMRQNPNKSLGLVLLNQKQRDLIIEEMNYVIANDSAVQKYIEHWEKHKDGLESFFVKNLENVQGDERDTIFIGTVYGPEKEGALVMQRFGPINGTTGKRRLNVLFTRAKERITTFSSMSAADIRANEANEGVTLLKKWLEYSATGKLLMDDVELIEREPDSMFERYVITQLKLMGCEVIPQVGVTGYFIDIGIKHSEWPHGYIMGVECDGASYHSSKSARDRDRLRQEILEGLGWKLYRIWSTDWFEDPIRQSQKLREVVEGRLKELKQPPKGGELF